MITELTSKFKIPVQFSRAERHIRDFFDIPGGFDPRPAQIEIVDKIEKAILAGKKFIIIQAPTGTGKTEISDAAMTYIVERHGRTTIVCTSTKILQTQYTTSHKDIKVVKGRSNFECEASQYTDPKQVVTCDKGLCKSGFKCPRKPLSATAIKELHLNEVESAYTKVMGGVEVDKYWAVHEGDRCPYWVQKVEAINSAKVAPNYTYMLHDIAYSKDFRRRELLISDEGHNIEKQIMEFIAIPITQKLLNTITLYLEGKTIKLPEYMAKEPRFDYNLDTHIDWTIKKLLPALNLAIEKMQEKAAMLGKKLGIDEEEDGSPVVATTIKMVDNRTDGKPEDERKAEYNNLLKDFEDVSTAISRISGTVQEEISKNREIWAVVKTLEKDKKTQKGFEFKPVKIAKYAKDVYFRMGRVNIIMSATILDHKLLADSLGIDLDETEYIEVPPAFPVENHRIYELKAASFSYVDGKDPMSDPKFCRDVVDRVDAILALYPNQKGIIHCTTYLMQNKIYENSRYRGRLIVHDSFNREEKLAQHSTGAQNNCVILSPSMTEGVDLKGELSEFQVLMKYPYPNITDPVMQKRKIIDPWYVDFMISMTVIQEIGRSIRGHDDKADTWVIDNRFSQLSFKNPHMNFMYTRHLTKLAKLKEFIKSEEKFNQITAKIDTPKSKFKKTYNRKKV